MGKWLAVLLSLYPKTSLTSAAATTVNLVLGLSFSRTFQITWNHPEEKIQKYLKHKSFLFWTHVSFLGMIKSGRKEISVTSSRKWWTIDSKRKISENTVECCSHKHKLLQIEAILWLLSTTSNTISAISLKLW